ncbi:phage/plasmid primase, P4 family [Sphingomonas koreensis]
MGQAALQLVRRGWPVFPCRERDETIVNSAKREIHLKAKAPYTGQGLKDATRDERRVEAWWRQHPNALIGVPMGVNGCFALDFDPRVEDVVDPDTGEITGTREFTLEELKAELETQIGVPLPPSLTSITQSGGVHVWFRQPDDGGEPIRNRGHLPDHVDVRGLGGYVIAPPSVTRDAEGAELGRYRWYGKRGDWRDEASVMDAPPELIEILRAPKRKAGADNGSGRAAPTGQSAERPSPATIAADVDADVRKYALSALDGECRSIREAGSGRRNAQLNASAFNVATLVAAGALDTGVARASIEAAARDNPGRDDAAQLEATISSGWTAGLSSPRDLAEIAAASRSRRERRPPGGRPAPPTRAAAAAPANSEPFRDGRLEGLSEQPEGTGERLKKASAAWLARRCEHVEPSKDAVVRLALSVGRRVAAGLLDASAAKESLWAVYEDIADVQHADIDRAIGDGMDRGFNLKPLLIAMKCSGYPLTDFGIGERFRDRFGDDFRFTTAKGWLGWDKRRWRVLDQDEKSPPAELIAAVMETVRAIQDEAGFVRDTGVRWELVKEGKDAQLDLERNDNPHGMDRWIPKGKSFELLSTKIALFGRQSETAGKPAAIAALARRWLTLPIEDFDRDPLAINVLNGTLRFTRELQPDGSRVAGVTLEPHSREHLNTKLAPVEYDPSAVCPTYDGFFTWAQPEEGMRRYLHQVAGYAASGDTSEQKLWFWYGLGANGKSTAIDLWAHVVGDYSGTIGIETFLDQGIKKRGEQASPDLARLGGVRLLRASEPERGSKLNEALIKAATGGEPMAVRALHRGFFDLQPLFKLIIGGNYKPDIPGTDEGIWRRMKLVPWNAHVEDKDRDETLPAKLRAEAAGVFNHIVRGLIDWLANGLVEPQAVKEATAQYREDSDPLARFLTMCVEVTGDFQKDRVQSSKLHEVFVGWCKVAGEREWSQKGFTKAMLDKGFKKKPSDGMQWLGMRLIKQVGDFVDDEGKARDWTPADREGDAARAPPPDDGRHRDDIDWEPPL